MIFQAHSRDEIELTLKEVLSRPELNEEKSLFSHLWDWLWANFDFSVVDAFGLLRAILVGLAILAIFYAWTVWLRSRRLRSREEGNLAGAGVRSSRARELVEKARKARELGDKKKALRLYLSAILVRSGQKGGLIYRSSWTNRELLRRGEPEGRLRDVLEPLVLELEPKEFGRESIGAFDLDRLETLWEEIQQRTPVSERRS